MEISAIKLQNWRSHRSFRVSLGKVTVLVGSNASGKTNLLEAIYYLSTGKSFRAKDDRLIGWDEPYARIDGDVVSTGEFADITVVLEREPKLKKTVKIKDQKVASSKLLGRFQSVLFTPEEIELISNLPEARRRYLNMVISQVNRKYAMNLLHFRRTLEQRNALLKRIYLGVASVDELEVWDGRLAEYADFLVSARAAYVRGINIRITKHYQNLSDSNAELLIKYLPSLNPGGGWSEIVLRLAESRERDVLARVTTVGPHRDDIAFLVDNRNVLDFASRGELRTVILALKLAEVDYLEEVSGERPVLLLDDVYSELDESRRDLLSGVLGKQQTIITTTDIDHINQEIAKDAVILEISQNG